MATFPRNEADTVQLAQQVAAGLTNNKDDFPDPPVDPVELQAVLEEYAEAAAAVRAAAVAASERYAIKTAVLRNMIDLVKADLRYAEFAAKRNHAKLKQIGWGGRRPKRPLEAPGQVRNLEAVEEGVGWIKLDWKKPREGGKVASYRIESNTRKQGEWHHVSTTAESEIELTDQEHGVELEYQVIAFNRAGESVPSNAVLVVL